MVPFRIYPFWMMALLTSPLNWTVLEVLFVFIDPLWRVPLTSLPFLKVAAESKMPEKVEPIEVTPLLILVVDPLGVVPSTIDPRAKFPELKVPLI